MKAKEKELLEYLQRYCPGRENAISGKQLKKRFRVHEAELRKLVHNLRVDGAPICSDRTGYFYPANAWEVIATIGHLRRMRDGVEKAIRSLERSTGDFRLPAGSCSCSPTSSSCSPGGRPACWRSAAAAAR